MRKTVWVLALAMAGCGGGTSPADSGNPVDSGVDAGFDAGEDVDSGTDAGDVVDSGTDAGLDGGDEVDAGTDAGAQPIIAPDDTWTWVDFPESRCASGTPTGLAVNPHAGSTDLVIYFEGGGSCADGTTCWGPAPTAKNLDGYDATTFMNSPQQNYPLLSRNRPNNPFVAMNLVYVPYCTGDLHAGTVMKTLNLGDGGTKDTYFYGANDLELFLARLKPTFPGVTRVWMTGTSAGGFGSYLDYDRVQRAFGVRTDVLDDSGPPLTYNGTSGNGGLANWGYAAPVGCAPCTSYRDVLDVVLAVNPGRYGFMSFTQDPVISSDFGYTLGEYPAVLGMFSSSLPATPRAATFYVTDEQQHVVQSDPLLAPRYFPWVQKMVNDDPSWADVCITRDGGAVACP